MPIDTAFAFHQVARHAGLTQEDFLGLLRDFVGHNKTRSWTGDGFNLLWRPHFGGSKDFFLQLMFTDETLDFTDITGTGIANRGFKQKDILLGGVAYLQQIKDSFDQSDQHFEPGVWANIPSTESPQEPATVTRMGSIPHGTTINLQGQATLLGTPDMDGEIFASSIKPFTIDDDTDIIQGAFDAEQDVSATNVSRTDLSRVAALTQEQLDDPNLILRQANAGLTFDRVVRVQVASTPKLAGNKPDVGGGTRNIAFLEGKDLDTKNADAPTVSATFWIQDAKDQSGNVVKRIQYTQRVLLNFNGLSWPHVSLGTLTLAQGQATS